MSQSFNYRHLFYFWVVAKEGGIARAAERLDMAVQTISAQVRELEKALGVSLLRTEGRSLVLTDAGVAALHEADHIFALGELLPQRVREAASGPTLRLNLGISDGIAKLAVHRLLTPVLDEPHLRLLCHEGEFQPLLGELALHKLDVFMRGDVEVQDEGSQLLALMLGAKRGEMVADFCAGAGGKTLALGAEMRNTGRLYAFDTSGHRLASLKPRLARSGLSNVYPVQIAHERDERIKRLAGKLDRVLVDAPCSGLGTLRRNPDLKWRQTPQAIEEMRVKQAAILASAARLVKPGGRLVYATCSLLEAENEEIAQAFSAERGADFAVVPAVEALAKAHVAQAETLVRGDYLRLWPHRHGTDGFFAAVWQRH